MKKKFLIASHGNLASGLQNSIEILSNRGNELSVINAYITSDDYTDQITDFINNLSDNEQGIIFTDLYGGSVNQKVVNEVISSNKANVFVISNTNLAVVLSVLFAIEDVFTDEILEGYIKDSNVSLVKTIIKTDDNDLDSFF